MSINDVSQYLTQFVYEPMRRLSEVMDRFDDWSEPRDPLLSDDSDLGA